MRPALPLSPATGFALDFAPRQSEAPMSSRNRLWVAAFLGTAGLLATATPAAAQFYGGAGYSGAGGFNTYHYSPVPRSWFALPPVRPVSPVPGVNGFNPLMFSPFNPNYDPRLQSTVTYYY